MTDDRPFVSDAERRRHEHLSAARPTSADRVSNLLNDLTADNERLEHLVASLREERDTMFQTNLKLARDLQKLEDDKRVLMEQVEHGAAQLHTARDERDRFQAKLRRIHNEAQGA